MKKTFKEANLPKITPENSETGYIWNVIFYTDILLNNRELYERLNDDNINAVAKKALKNLSLM